MRLNAVSQTNGSTKAVAAFLAATLLVVGCASGARAPDASAPSLADAESLPNQPRGDAGTVQGARDATASRDSSADDTCNELELSFETRTPTVYVLVDRSSSMFERNLWNPLKTGVLAVIKQLEGEVRFGFASYTGQSGGVCPDLTKVDTIATGNHAAIQRAYDALRMPTYKGETPTSLAIDEVAKLLQKEPSGPKYILLVTDGEADFCDDPNVTCSRDAVLSAAQAAYTAGVGTFIFSIGGQVDRMHLADVANAGSGQPVTDRQMQVMYQCPTSKTAYSSTSGTASFFEPDVNDQATLVDTLSSVVTSARSCVFDLKGKVEIDLTLADQGVVELDGVRVPYDAKDGYQLNTSTELELRGKSCERFRSPEPRRVFIDFPCEAVLVI